MFVASFGAEGIVRTVSGQKVDVEIRGKRMRVSVGDLRQGPPPGAPSAATGRPGAVSTRPTPGPGVEGRAAVLVLIGHTVDEALDKVAKFLDDALLTDERRLRVVHGHGTGRLREAVRAYFRDHPLVAQVSAAPDNEGGGGATIVELKD